MDVLQYHFKNYGIKNNGTPIENIDHYDLLLDVPVVSQKSEFPNACESVSVIMLLKYYGYNISVQRIY